jgi:hypothetical protein
MNIMTAPDKPPRQARLKGSRGGRPVGTSYTFKQRDLKSAIKAARDAGLENFRIDIDRQGTISVVPTAPAEPVEPAGGNEWDEVLKE